MTIDEGALAVLLAKEDIRELAALYCRAIDRRDFALCRSLYTADGWDTHGNTFDGTADEFVAHLEKNVPLMRRYSGHHICNHLISVGGDTAEGEVYARAHNLHPDGKGGVNHGVLNVRYIDQYRKENGRWLFANRYVTFDLQLVTPLNRLDEGNPDPTEDPSYAKLTSPLFARGPRL